MAPNSKGKDVQAYPPTSLDFINRPNPVEPLAAPPKHPLHSSSQLHHAYPHDLRRLLLDTVPRDTSGEAAAKRLRQEDGRSRGAGQARDLPSLPKLSTRSASGTHERRRRLPPTLSGLHQPPPNAGLLPSISVHQPRHQNTDTNTLVAESRNHGTTADVGKSTSDARPMAHKPVSQKPVTKTKTGRPAKNKWSDDETADLLKGVAKFGIGSWTKILKHEEYSFDRRTALDLKDRFRVCCPEHYKKPKPNPTGEHGEAQPKSKQPKPNHRKGASELAQLGIEKPFQKSGRRSRHGYTKEQDDALLRGFRKHGKSWAAILKDEQVLAERTSTDLRDRFRLRYPQEYASVGLVPRPENFPRPPDRGSPDEASEDTPAAGETTVVSQRPSEKDLGDSRSHHPVFQPAEPSFPHRGIHPHISLSNDVFFGMPADDEEMDAEPLVLDRGILDWAFETTKTSQPETTNSRGDYPLPTRPPGAMQPPSGFTSTGNVSASLPSLATITAVSDDYDQLELPSMMQYFPSFESDTRTGSHGFLPLEDLLSQT